MKKSWILSLLFSTALTAQAGEEFWQWKDEHVKTVGDLKAEISSADKQYIDILKSDWVEVPVTIDNFEPINFPENYPERKSKEIKNTISTSALANVTTALEIIESDQIVNRRIDFDFYKHSLKIKDSSRWSNNSQIRNNQDIAEIWQYFSTLESDGLITQFKVLKEELHLNDWDYAYMLYQYSGIWQSYDKNQLLQTQYLLVHSGLNVRLGLKDELVYLFMNSKHNVLDEAKIIDDNMKSWYLMDFENNIELTQNVTWVGQSHSNARDVFNLRVNPDLNLGGKWESRKFNYQVGVNQYEINLPYQIELINHYKKYPILSISDYVNHDVHNVVVQSIYMQLKKYIDGKNEIETINFLLNLVQTIFETKEEIAESKPMLLQQAIYNNNAQAYERVLLFKALIENTTKNYLMVVEYEKHLSIGVKLKSDHEFKTFRVNVGDYVLADPSFKHATLGRKIPLKESPFVQWHPIY